MKDLLAGMSALTVLALVIVAIAVAPFIALWAINTAFDTSFAITGFWDWLALALILTLIGK